MAQDKRLEDGAGPAAWLAAPTLALAWLIPGAGFAAHKRLARGAALFAAIHLTFALGVAMHGGLDWPAWSIHNPGFNIVNNLTFIIQMGAGLPALISLAADLGWARGALDFMAGQPSNPLFDLSGFYLLVAGAMNYFVVCNTYDRLFARAAAAQEPAGEDKSRGQA
ncbi:MAG: hypothetical protein BWZ10_03487 [candidate division BRC1 bacterium ADurb.BinA364]|nr:MAG: hypothetical protein BWZ10_03487 [candidate division BRC1 bacterium ADurb.BinA364]